MNAGLKDVTGKRGPGQILEQHRLWRLACRRILCSPHHCLTPNPRRAQTLLVHTWNQSAAYLLGHGCIPERLSLLCPSLTEPLPTIPTELWSGTDIKAQSLILTAVIEAWQINRDLLWTVLHLKTAKIPLLNPSCAQTWSEPRPFHLWRREEFCIPFLQHPEKLFIR